MRAARAATRVRTAQLYSTRSSAVLHWKIKPAVLLAVLVVVSAFVGGLFDGDLGDLGMYW